jgi:hypothetical protein
MRERKWLRVSFVGCVTLLENLMSLEALGAGSLSWKIKIPFVQHGLKREKRVQEL